MEIFITIEVDGDEDNEEIFLMNTNLLVHPTDPSTSSMMSIVLRIWWLCSCQRKIFQTDCASHHDSAVFSPSVALLHAIATQRNELMNESFLPYAASENVYYAICARDGPIKLKAKDEVQTYLPATGTSSNKKKEAPGRGPAIAHRQR